MLPIGRLPEFANLYAKTTARIYYSTDATLDPAGDIQLAQFPVSALAASAIQVNPVKLSVPGVTFNTSGATVYVQLDLIAVVQEISEINNQEDNDVFFYPCSVGYHPIYFPRAVPGSGAVAARGGRCHFF